MTGTLGVGPVASVAVADILGKGAAAAPAGNAFTKPEVTFGPAIPGAPWGTRRIPQRYGDPPAPPIPGPPGGGNNSAKPEVTFGPAFPGAPWGVRNLVEPNHGQIAPGPRPPGPVPKAKGLPFLERVPDISGPDGLNRLRRHTEKLSSIINSLVGTGQLIQIGPAAWEIMAMGIVSTGLTGTFNNGAFSGGGAIPGSGLTGTFNNGPF